MLLVTDGRILMSDGNKKKKGRPSAKTIVKLHDSDDSLRNDPFYGYNGHNMRFKKPMINRDSFVPYMLSYCGQGYLDYLDATKSYNEELKRRLNRAKDFEELKEELSNLIEERSEFLKFSYQAYKFAEEDLHII